MPFFTGYRDPPQLRYEPNLRIEDDCIARGMDLDEGTLAYLYSCALQREERLTRAEFWAKAEATRECELGLKWWRRGHP